MAERRAILIGVDGYSFRPLTSAVNDAMAMREALAGRSTPRLNPIFDDSEMTLFATPLPGNSAPPDAEPATRKAILGALKPYYDSNDPADFLMVYFAGHGLTASPDGRVRETLILPSDVTGPEDGSEMIPLDYLLHLFAERGPLQQLWIIDACRDMPYPTRPYGYGIAWPPQPPQSQRAQVAVFAVAQGGEALSETGGQGRFTTHLLDGLAGKGSAADHIPGRGHCVTAQSLHEYARRRVSKALEGYDDWTRTVQMPQISQASAALDPLRDIPAPSPTTFQVTVQPPEARPAVDLALEVQLGIPAGGWPPSAHPRIYELRATLKPGMNQQWGEPTPALSAVDLREEQTATINVPPRPVHLESIINQTYPLQPTTGERGIAQALTVTRGPSEGLFGPVEKATLIVTATDPGARVHLQRAEPPWEELDDAPNTKISVDPGVWNVTVLLGDQIISATRVVLSQAEVRTVRAVAQITPATAALLPRTTSALTAPETVTPSVTIGAMQGAILPTLLPLLGLKLYDREQRILYQFKHLDIPIVSADEIPEGKLPFAVAIAFEGPRPPNRRASVEGSHIEWLGPESRLALFAGWKRSSFDTITIDFGSRRVNVATPGITGGVTVVTGTSWPDGRLDFSVTNFHLPVGTLWGPGAPDHVAVGQISRALALAVPLFRAGANLEETSDWVLSEIAYAKWMDPVLGVLAFHARDYRLATQASQIDPSFVEHLKFMRERIRSNLLNHFRELPDSRIIGALDTDAEVRSALLAELLDDLDLGQPVLTASLAHLAQAATNAGRDDHWSVDRFARIVPGQVFNVVRVK